jgi:hypothetical protein
MFYRKLHIEDKIWLYKIGKWRGENILVKSPEGKRFLLQRKDVVKGVEFFDFVLYPPQPITPSMVKSHILKHLISPPIKSK